MQTRADVAAAIGLSEAEFNRLLYGTRARQRYRTFAIPKRSGGIRTIEAPPGHLLYLQTQLHAILSRLYQPKPCVHGFAAERSIVTNAQAHARRRYVVNFDLANFFPTINFGRVVGLFSSQPFSYGRHAAQTLAQICCTHAGHLPQGGATSPLISNLICRSLDNSLLKFAARYKLRYTRYADDLTFSSGRSPLPTALIQSTPRGLIPGRRLDEIISAHGFAVNIRKVSLRSKYSRQEVTGLTVNEFPNVRRDFIRRIEGALYSWERHGYQAAQLEYMAQYRELSGVQIENVVRGQIAYVKMVRGKHDFIFRRLARRYNRLAESSISVVPIQRAAPCKMTSTPPSSGVWNSWVARYKDAVFLLQIETSDGTYCGSAFHVGRGILATAGHNLRSGSGTWYRVCAWIGDNRVRPRYRTTHAPLNGSLPIDTGLMLFPQLVDSVRIPTQLRLPEIGEEVLAIGFPTIPQRDATIVAHVGTVEALPLSYDGRLRFIQVSFQSGGGLSGGCVIDRGGHALGIMIENVFMAAHDGVPSRPYGQAVPIEYFDEDSNSTTVRRDIHRTQAYVDLSSEPVLRPVNLPSADRPGFLPIVRA